ncbi:hypothetical protein DYB34_000296 [Aphanomyces astaci]|uniref:Helicase C-terminal domain-containing protein n=1 Tax=Aphanomyces astaci TaxID=112090 RepID=A0A418BN95_APHAT|nr:hypothetical protein DYB34_000296 [Aphanomyces astaci]
MSKRKKPAASPTDALPTASAVASAPWIQRFQLLDSCYCFLVGKKAIPSLKTIVSLAAHLSGNPSSLEVSHVRQMVSIGVVKLDIQARDKVIVQDDFNPAAVDPHETIELVQFPDAPHPSKRASTKRMLLFQHALQTTTIDLANVPKFEPLKRLKSTSSQPSASSPIPYLNTLMQASYYDGQVVHIETIPSRAARFGDRQLQDLGVCDTVCRGVLFEKIYSHQSEAIQAILEGHHVVISTSTSSGKSIVYNVPVAHALSTSNSTAFYLFPTKVCTLFQSAFLVSLVVIDEAHMYRGIFGSHVANILRRLFRLCYVYGSSPQVVCCSASIQNPRQHFSWLVPHQSLQPAARTPSDDPFPNTNASPEITVIEQDKDGSPCGTKHFVVWRPTPPPVTSFDPNEPHNPDLTGSTIFQSAQILATLVAAKVPTIAFCRGRKLTELVVEYTHNVLRRQNQSHLIPRVKGYRGGYSVESRRAIEAQLFRHELLGVVATNALELGIDIGSLECTLHLGYPPSIASMWQQAGRAGRSGHDSMAVIVCFDSPLDAYNTSLGSAMFAKPPEPVVLDPTNLFVVKQHLQCASLEMDLLSPRSGTLDIDRVMFTRHVDEIVVEMASAGQLMALGDQRGFRVPAKISLQDMTIRDISSENYTAKIVLAKQSPSRLKYYTCCRDFTDIDISTTFLPSVAYSSHVHLGIAHATTYVVGCYSLEKRTQKILNRTDFSLPPMEADGHAVWMDIPIHVGGPSKGLRDPIRDALHGVNHLILAVIPHFMLVDGKDLATEHVTKLETRARYDRYIYIYIYIVQ